MAIKKYKPTTPGRRGMTVTDYSVLSKVEPERSLLEPMKKHSGRNNTGRITVRHHGGGNRTKYRVIDFKRNKFDVPATVQTLEYDPNRSAFIALIQFGKHHPDDIGDSEEHMGNQPGRESKDLREDRTEQREDNPPADTNDNIGGKHGNLV